MIGKHIVVLEDNLATLNMVSRMLESAGYRVTPTADGETVIKEARTDPPDLLVCDLAMPGVDGFDVIRQLRMSHPQLPIIAVSGLGADKGRVAIDTGASAFLEKPVDEDRLLEEIERQFRRLEKPVTEKKVSGHVMIYEDDPMTQRLLRKILESGGYRVTGIEAGAAAFGVVEDDPPDLIVCDLEVPGVDGFQLVSVLREEYELETPVLIVSGHTNKEAQAEAFSAGATAFMGKPVKKEDFLAEVARLLGHGR